MRYEIGTTNALRCQVPVSEGTIQLVPKPRKMAIIVPRCRRKIWEGVPVANWCSEWICRMRGGLGPHLLIIPVSLSFLPMRGTAVGQAPTILENVWLLHQNLQFCPISNFVGHYVCRIHLLNWTLPSTIFAGMGFFWDFKFSFVLFHRDHVFHVISTRILSPALSCSKYSLYQL